MSRLDETFRRLRARGERALVAYVTAGDPSLAETGRLVREAARRGADVIELGVPFSDPLADGPVIHAAATEALRAGVTPLWVLEVCAALSERLPVVLMAYANLLLGHAGFDHAAPNAATLDPAMQNGHPKVAVPYSEFVGVDANRRPVTGPCSWCASTGLP